MHPPDNGTITINQNQMSKYSASNAVNQGVGYVPRERKVEGIVNGMNIFENITLCQLDNYSSKGVLKVSEEKKIAVKWIERLGIKTPSEKADCGGLSGGNQQKVVLAKWIRGSAISI